MCGATNKERTTPSREPRLLVARCLCSAVYSVFALYIEENRGKTTDDDDDAFVCVCRCVCMCVFVCSGCGVYLRWFSLGICTPNDDRTEQIKYPFKSAHSLSGYLCVTLLY